MIKGNKETDPENEAELKEIPPAEYDLSLIPVHQEDIEIKWRNVGQVLSFFDDEFGGKLFQLKGNFCVFGYLPDGNTSISFGYFTGPDNLVAIHGDLIVSGDLLAVKGFDRLKLIEGEIVIGRSISNYDFLSSVESIGGSLQYCGHFFDLGPILAMLNS